MSFLFADTARATGLLPFVRENWLLLLPPILGFVGIYALLPRARQAKPMWGGVLATAGLITGGVFLVHSDAVLVERVLFCAFAGLALVAGVMMITQKNPVHAAMSFAMVVLSTCGLFLLQAAPFLMAATIIIYAGAIVVTFLFVIMLAQQDGATNADRLSREPFLASLAGCVLLVALVCILHKAHDTAKIDSVIASFRQLSEAKDMAQVKRLFGEPSPGTTTPELVVRTHGVIANVDSPVQSDLNNIRHEWNRGDKARIEVIQKHAKNVHVYLEAKRRTTASLGLDDVPGKASTPGHFSPGKLPAENVAGLGRTLFTDYLIAVELAAALLLVATIGAIVIAGRRAEGLR